MPASQVEKAERFRVLHARPGAFVIPNPWDAGTARILASLGFEALTTTSAGLAFTLGRRDGAGAVTREETLANAKAIVDATDLPVAADLENGFGHTPEAAAETIRLAGTVAGLVGGSIEDATGDPHRPIYDFQQAKERVAAAAAAARALPFPFVLVGRAENFLHGRPDLGRHDPPPAGVRGRRSRRPLRPRAHPARRHSDRVCGGQQAGERRHGPSGRVALGGRARSPGGSPDQRGIRPQSRGPRGLPARGPGDPREGDLRFRP